MAVFLIVPRALRDPIYDIVSNLRHRIAGTTNSCEIPSDAFRQRMI
jgi:predicted DCC family thiol-disulfide oxidoreductase YuxK